MTPLFEERLARMSAITQRTSVREDYGLLKVAEVAPGDRSRIEQAVKIYLWSCLTQHFPEQVFDVGADPLTQYAEFVERLPNVTPNGLVLPKAENLFAYNALHRVVSDAVKALKIDDQIARVQFPINIRLQSGRPDPQRDERPHSSTKMHSDIWVGDPAGGIIVFLSVLGDPDKVGIRFFEPPEFPEAFIRSLDNFDEGQALAERSAELSTRFTDHGWFFVDPFLIHRTTKSGSGMRLSVDFRFIPKNRVESDRDEDEIRRPYFIAIEDWHAVGRDRMLVTDETLAGFRGDDGSRVGYPVEFRIVPLREPR